MTDPTSAKAEGPPLTRAHMAAAVKGVFGQSFPFTVTRRTPIDWLGGETVELEVICGTLTLHSPADGRLVHGQIYERSDDEPAFSEELRGEITPKVREKIMAFVEQNFPWAAPLAASGPETRGPDYFMVFEDTIDGVIMPSRLEVDTNWEGEVKSFWAYYEPDTPPSVVKLTKEEAIETAQAGLAGNPRFQNCEVKEAWLKMKRFDQGLRTVWYLELFPLPVPGEFFLPHGGGPVAVDAATGEILYVGAWK
ncbi:MAG: PepSY domain-containing protein [Actinomycetota bacterium]